MGSEPKHEVPTVPTGDARINPVTWDEFRHECELLAARADGQGTVARVHGVPQGGYPVAVEVARILGVPVVLDPEDVTLGDRGLLVVDDLVDSGATGKLFTENRIRFDALYRKAHSPVGIADDATTAEGWLVFPWESTAGPEDAVRRILEFIGEDPNREGLLDTPARVVKAWREMTVGYTLDPADVLSTTFDEQSDEMVVLRGITFASSCEHHMLPFTGTATVGYVPDDRVVGLSKMARLVHVYAKRLQVQERMTSQIADAMWATLRPLGVGVVIHGHHSCMSCRGVGEPNAIMTTSSLLGIMKHSDATRSEFLRLANGGGH